MSYKGFLLNNFIDVKTTKIDITNAKSYKIGQIITIDSTKAKGFKAGQKFKIVGIKDEKPLIIDGIPIINVKRDFTRKNLEFNISDNINFVSIFDNSQENFFELKDQIIFTRRIFDTENKNISLARIGYIGTISEIFDDGFISVKINQKLLPNGKLKKLKSDSFTDGNFKVIKFNYKDNPYFQHFKSKKIENN